MTSDARRALPSVSSLIEQPAVAQLARSHSRALVTEAARAAIARVRSGERALPPDPGAWVSLIGEQLDAASRSSLRRVINATGIVLHTNLGRAPLAPAAVEAIRRASSYTTLEYDVTAGARGSRDDHCVNLLRELTGAEDAVVVNNCAAALVLALNTLAAGRDVLVSRGELVEIGGTFRIPDIMARAGARLVEVGTTNRTHLLDYRAAITANTAAIAKVHRSNFAIAGFTSEVTLSDLGALGAERDLPVVFDHGSGLLFPLERYGFPPEPTARDAVEAGASLVLMSGDKLLGGPQAGIVVGRAAIVESLRRNPLMRALRVDKLTLAALEATLALHRDPDVACREIPTLAMLTGDVGALRRRAEAIAASAGDGARVRVAETSAAVGAGAFPTHRIQSCGVALAGDVESLAYTLRTAEPGVVGRVHDGELLLDLRTVSPADDETVVRAIRALA